ncbi:hypothetical protein J2810_004437 [Chryseobacterium rhizosphaerae]|uniref:hypothetical protein n=1 Tax=Chryseobacterium rhizosphaerae TaxID=395937 RepID=UPI00285F6683|nr:hypothetical protein [Chryseobacterium rhizosphaerae]MDR6548347.1 hypothetical protein [Chryseobacterium rhizosphaerae]
MRSKIILVFFSFFLFFSCKKKKTDAFNLSYIRENNNVMLNYENNTNTDIVFLAPNVIEFESLKNKDYQNVYGLIKPNQSDKYYQKILDSLYNKTLIAENKQDLIDLKRLYMSHSVFYLKKNGSLKVSYELKIQRTAVPSKYKQIYYPYPRGIEENYLEKDYIGKFSKLNFGKAKFVLQPVIEDSLFINISRKDTDY